MKKRILSIILSVILLTPATVFAKNIKSDSNAKHTIEATSSQSHENSDDKEINNNHAISEQKENGKEKEIETNTNVNVNEVTIKKQEKNTTSQENKAANNSAKEQFKAQLRAKHEIMKANITKINELKKEINLKKAELETILTDIQQGKKTLSSEQLTLLTQKAALVKQSADAVKALPKINSDVDRTQENIKGSKFEVALSSLDNVIAKQEARYVKLVDLNTKLDDLLSIARQAVDVSTAASSSNTSDTTSVSNSSAEPASESTIK